MLKNLISVVLGLLIVLLFCYAANNKKCIIIKGFSKKEIDNKTFRFKDRCFRYNQVKTKCNINKE